VLKDINFFLHGGKKCQNKDKFILFFSMKARLYVPCKLFQLSLIFSGKAEAFPSLLE
jgi:hypothetical protein